ncbi:MAG: alpha/beta hydrolase [Actinomycetota bacterium]|nr:alpha/beta hydrolase [Actinomycetota bacterium]
MVADPTASVSGLPVPGTGASAPAAGLASVTREFVRLRPQTFGLLYSPTAPGAEASVGLVVMHPNADFLEHVAGVELARRGFRVLCINGQYFNTNRETMIWEQVPLDVKPAVEYLRNLAGIRTVALVGHSGGGQLMPFYQNVAENGPEASRGADRIAQGGDDLADLPPADALVLLDAHHGYSANTLTSMDPSVRDESRPSDVDPTLDVFNPANGYDPAGSMYGDDFKQRYFRAQAERMQRLNEAALARNAAIAAGQGQFPDDEPFPLARSQARLWQLDTRLVSHTKGAYPVIKPDGSIVVDVARSVRVSGVTPKSGGAPSLTARQNASWAQGAVAYTVRSWLSSNALWVDPDRYTITEDDIRGIDWHSSNTSTPANLEGVRVPLLIMAMTGHYWLVPGEIFFQHAASPDKQLVFVEGASHNIVPCRACEQYPGQYGDTVQTTFDYVAAWLRERFL